MQYFLFELNKNCNWWILKKMTKILLKFLIFINFSKKSDSELDESTIEYKFFINFLKNVKNFRPIFVHFKVALKSVLFSF